MKAKCKKTNLNVAVKKIFFENEKEGFPITALRELMFLKKLRHENIAELIEICNSKATANNQFKNQCYLVFIFYDHDLAGIIANKRVKFSFGEIKSVINQILNALYYIHNKKILHRDIKSANIFISKETGKIKVGDFGLARSYTKAKPDQPNRYTNKVVTLWYRAPELLLGERNYTAAIDIWGVGCIMAELWTRSPIMQGRNETNQLMLISNLCGSIGPSVWPDVAKLPLYAKMNLVKSNLRFINNL